jgi:hypothetical protein
MKVTTIVADIGWVIEEKILNLKKSPKFKKCVFKSISYKLSLFDHYGYLLLHCYGYLLDHFLLGLNP